ncbi:hypothetical protein P7H12_04285 [Paenibacillus larvae]|nr:hypothetical protein [Paenibacillus larvae]MDT2263014.1 hypothetical protein [Paenibacillus larvae]
MTAISAESVEAHKHVTKAVEQVVQGSETQLQSAEQSSTAMEEMAGGIQRIAGSPLPPFPIRWPGPLRKRNAGMRQFRRL